MVKCVECGLLSVRSLRLNQLTEVDEETRRTGKYVDDPSGGFNVIQPLLCCVLEYNLSQEVDRENDKGYVEVIKAERDCQKFREWQPGLSPKEHVLIVLVDDWREWLKECSREAAVESRKTQRQIAIIGVCGAVISGLIGTAFGFVLANWNVIAKMFLPNS